MDLRVRMLAAVLAIGAVGLSACGNGAEPSTDLAVTTTEFQFSPQTWTVPAGEEISIDITNSGTVVHEWVLLKPGVTISSEADLPETEEELLADFVYIEDEVDPGTTKTLTFTAPAAGTYQVICAIPGHFGGGMEATLNVTG